MGETVFDIDKTLVEQMRITDQEISLRKDLLDFSESDVELLLSCKELVATHIDTLVNEFYRRQTEVEEIALLIGDADTLGRLRVAQRAYVLGLFEGYYDIEYVNNRLRIGMVHKRIGVEPKLYLSAMRTLKSIIIALLQRNIADQAYLAQVVDALDKLLYFDTTLVFDTYIRSLLAEVELEKSKTLSYATGLELKVLERTRQLQEMSERDALTGIYNTRSFRDYLRRELLAAKRRNQALALVYFDVDEFKDINDRNGHHTGDKVLQAVGESLLKVARDIDFPCRYGGDEFCLALPDCTAVDAERICRRLIDEFSPRAPDVSFSIGIAQAGPVDYPEPDQLICDADRQMYASKAHPGFHISRPATAEAADRDSVLPPARKPAVAMVKMMIG